MSRTMLLASTKRGLFLLSSEDRKEWQIDRHTMQGKVVYNAALDPRTGRMFATDNNVFFGSKLLYSDDMGETWQEPARGIEFPEASGLALQNLWIIEPSEDEPGRVYVGVDPASLWVSDDNGENWSMNEGLQSHPTRERWNPGNGGLCLHSIVRDHSDKDRMWIGISAVGCMRTEDGGKTWTHANKNTRQDFGPELYPEYGQCIHRLVQHPDKPDVLYQQNHCGVYMSENGGDDWIDIRNNLPGDFGFPIALDRHHPETLYTVVVEPWGRHNYGDQFTVYRSQDAGGSWESLSDGLPNGTGVKLGVLRHGMWADTADPCGVYVGTNTGQIFASDDRGDSWQMIADFLPPVNAVRAVTLD
ncbi:MAG TPA: exo-alpha-sialidase [Chloroflexota bacterium]|nr:exo-alpha-sialidase [Chloroflexota bacterium]